MRWVCCALAAWFAAAVITGLTTHTDLQPAPPMTRTTHTSTP